MLHIVFLCLRQKLHVISECFGHGVLVHIWHVTWCFESFSFYIFNHKVRDMTGLHPNITLLSCSTDKTLILEEAAVLPFSTYMTSQMPMIGQGCCDRQGYIPSTQRAQGFALSYSQPWVDAELMSRWWGERLFLVLVENRKWLWFWKKKSPIILIL